MTHTCPVCATSFPGHPDRVYCSQSCAGRGNVANNMSEHWSALLRRDHRSWQKVKARHEARRRPTDKHAELMAAYVKELQGAEKGCGSVAGPRGA